MNNKAKLRILFVSSLYPNSAQPDMAPYNRQLIGALAKQAETRIIAPVFWFPCISIFRKCNLPPELEVIDGIKISHPRIFHTPGIFVYKHWIFYRRAIRRHLVAAINEFKPDHVIIGFAYPDGTAIAPICRDLGVNYSIRINGSDFRIRVRQEKFRKMVLKTLSEAPMIFCPGDALRRDMIAEGIDGGKIVAFNNGVDGSRFHLRSKEEALKELSVIGYRLSGQDEEKICRLSSALCRPAAKAVLFVGNLVHVKGVDRLLSAFAGLVNGSSLTVNSIKAINKHQENVSLNQLINKSTSQKLLLLLIGEGRLRRKLERQAQRLGIADTVVFLGSRPHDEIALWMNVADCLCLPSRSEGMPNAVIEALASGLPVVAANVGEIPFIVRDGENGYVVEAEGKRQGVSGKREEKRMGVWEYGSMGVGAEFGLAERLADAVEKTLSMEWDKEQIASRMMKYTWENAADVILNVLAK